MIDYEKQVLAGIVPSRRDHLLYAVTQLTSEHFRNETNRNVFELLTRYYDVAGDILPLAVLSDMLSRRGVEVTKSLLYEELYTELIDTSITDHEWRYAIDGLRDLRAQQKTGEAITTAYEILETGAEVDRQALKGHTDARAFLYSKLSSIDKLDATEAAPEGDMRKEADDVRKEYADRKSGKQSMGIRTGISTMDLATGGFANGELVMLCAYTGQGKSMLSTQTTWSCAVEQGKNVFFATSETVRSQVRRRLIARHSRLPQFGLPQGLDSKAIKDGTLTPAEEDVFNAVLDDLDKNPTYGQIYIAQIPRGATLSFIDARLQRQASNMEVHLVVVDYLALIRPDIKRQSQREEFNDILKDAKTLATSFDHGRGVPLLSPWAMSQSAFKRARETGLYELASLAETSEAEKSADQIITMLRHEDTRNEVKMQFLKLRDADQPAPLTLEADFRSTYVGTKSSGAEEMFGVDGDSFGF